MSTFTQENPFEFEGGKMWSNEQGDVVVDAGGMGSMSSPLVATRHHAFIEAENNVWHEDGDGFRKGPWVVLRHIGKPGEFMVSHVDFPRAGLVDTTGEAEFSDRITHPASLIADAFLEWYAANYPKQPAEPTGLGAVVEVPEREPCTPGARERFILTVESGHNPVPWMLAGDPLVRATWGALTDRGPVAVLSEGWTK